jgi:hypothetical protein
MSIELLSMPKWTTATAFEDSVIQSPQWSDIEAAIRKLDGSVSQEIYLHPKRDNLETWLSIGGGTGKYLVTGSINNEHFPTYVNGNERADDVPLLIGGQLGEFPNNWIVDVDVALQIAKAFWDAGAFECGVTWSYE